VLDAVLTCVGRAIQLILRERVPLERLAPVFELRLLGELYRLRGLDAETIVFTAKTLKEGRKPTLW